MLIAASYMMAMPNGTDVAAFRADIAECKRLGIQALLLNIGAWSSEPWLRDWTANIFEAARQDGDFRLGIMADCTGPLSGTDIGAMTRQFMPHPAYLRANGKPFFGAWGGIERKAAFWAPLVKDTHFVPTFYDAAVPGGWWTAPHFELAMKDYWPLIAGHAPWTIRGSVDQFVNANAINAAAMRAHDKQHWVGISTCYFFSSNVRVAQQPTMKREYFDLRGGEGIARQYRKAIEQDPFAIVTHCINDFTESWFLPSVSDPNNLPVKNHTTGLYKVGALLTDKSAHANEVACWNKFVVTGQIALPDECSIIYRPHPKDLKAPGDQQNIWQHDAQDAIYVTSRLVAPGELNGTFLPAGLHHTRLPFKPGGQVFTLVRGGRAVKQAAGPAIAASIKLYNFNETGLVL